MSHASRAYDAVRNIVEGLGGSMVFERKGHPHGAWVIRVGEKSITLALPGNRSLPELDRLYVPRVPNPSVWDDYSDELVPDAESRLQSMLDLSADDAKRPILDAAREWRQRCLVDDGSVLTDRSLWTRDLFDELDRCYVQRPMAGEGRFLQKLERQLDDASVEAKLLSAELLWVMYLFPTNMGGKRKIENIRTVWEWSGEEFPEAHELTRLLRRHRGIGSGGQGFLNFQWAELTYLITAMRDWKSKLAPERARLLNDPWAFAEWLDSRAGKGRRQLRQILRHLVFPEVFEPISSIRDKETIAAAFREEIADQPDPPGSPQIRTDRKLLAIRRALEERHPEHEVNFYHKPFIERWKKGPPDKAPELNVGKLEAYRSIFLQIHPDFVSFEAPPQRYVDAERGYKEELADELARRFADAPAPGELDSSLAARVVEDVRELLLRRLSYGWSQNLLNWRYHDFLRHLKPDEKDTFARAFLDLLFGDGSSEQRLERFNQTIWPILERTNSATYAISRSFPTLFLMLRDPEDDIFVRTDLFNEAYRDLVGSSPFENKPFDAGEYRKALGFARAIREQLESWGWAPQDMIDVQSFLWIVLRVGKPEAEGEGQTSDDGTTAPVQVAFQHLLDDLTREGLCFPAEVVANYLVALQTKRFAILTGISGTGKTKLAQHVARRMGADPDDPNESRYVVVAVRPEWTDSRGLLGYYNPLAKTYIPTPFLLLLLRARREENEARQEERPARPFFVVLDEMNLARVEHYFSDFLSAMESGEALELHHHGTVELTADGERWTIPNELEVPNNLFFTGTVNVDETTYMFSPKVLDRAFTLELNQVDLRRFGSDEAGSGAETDDLVLDLVPVPLRMEQKPSEDDWRWLAGQHNGALRRDVEDLNDLLESSGRHFGYRVVTEIARFVRIAVSQTDGDGESAWSALDLAILQKVLPKFHGTQQELEEPLHKLLSFAVYGEPGQPVLEDEGEPWTIRANRLVATDPAATQRPRLPRTAAKTWRMLRQLPARGFTSFIE